VTGVTLKWNYTVTWRKINEAINAADSRMVHLSNVMRNKSCEIPK